MNRGDISAEDLKEKQVGVGILFTSWIIVMDEP
jgi:hypothetical protein